MPQTEHISKQFETDLDTTRTRVLQMGGLVESQLMAAIEALSTGSDEVINRVVDTERRVNTHEKEIDDACVHVVARRQPAASDLRLIMGVSKIVTDLERIGDEAVQIARYARRLQADYPLMAPRYGEIEHMTDLVLTTAFYCAVVRVLATMKIDNEPQYKEVLKQYPIPGVS